MGVSIYTKKVIHLEKVKKFPLNEGSYIY